LQPRKVGTAGPTGAHGATCRATRRYGDRRQQDPATREAV